MSDGSFSDRGDAPTLAVRNNGDANSAALRHWLQPLRVFLDADDVEELSINRPGQVFVLGRDGWTQHDVPLLDFTYCMALARLIATYTNQKLDAHNNLLSASLPLTSTHADVAALQAAGAPMIGERCQIVIPPSCQAGTVCFSFRKHSIASSTLEALDASQRFSACVPSANAITTAELEHLLADEHIKPHDATLLRLYRARSWAQFLQAAIKADKNILIAGATGSGKTYLTRTLVHEIDPADRIITIEDTPELPLPHHPNHVHLFYSKDDQGISSSTPKSLIAACMRLLPKRILLSEVRGDEAWDFLRVLGSGHAGSMTTLHAGSADEAFAELLKMTKSSETGRTMATEDLYATMYGVVDVVLHLKDKYVTELYYNPARRQQAINGTLAGMEAPRWLAPLLSKVSGCLDVLGAGPFTPGPNAGDSRGASDG